MLGKNDRQMDLYSSIIYNTLIPKDHLLLKIDSIIDFSFVYDTVKDYYSEIGRKSKDPVMMVKICLLEYLYNLSDLEVVKRIQTDVAFRWFLELKLDDESPDDSTISHFRSSRLGEKSFNEFFNEIVKKCIEKDIVKTRRFMIDSTDVAANVNYPSEKKLICEAYRRSIDEIKKFNERLGNEQLKKFEENIQELHKKSDKVSKKEYALTAKEKLEYLYLRTYDELQSNDKYKESFSLVWDLAGQTINDTKDKIVSIVDPDARVAHKSFGNIKRGYKDHILVDEDSEIILGSIQTPFNVGDEKKLTELIEKTKETLGINPEEVTADKAYGTTDNRAYLKDNEIISNIAFYKEPDTESEYFSIKDFKIDDNLEWVTCPNEITTSDSKILEKKDRVVFCFDKKICSKCPMYEKCVPKSQRGKKTLRGRRFELSRRYDAVITDKKRVETKEFIEAYNKRYKIERRFAAMVRKHGLRRCRYLRLAGAKIHITLANMVCNIIRMVNILFPPNIVMPKIQI